MQTQVEETGGAATATGKIWKLVYKAHAVRLSDQSARVAAQVAGSSHTAFHKKYTIVQTERDDYANTNKTIHVII